MGTAGDEYRGWARVTLEALTGVPAVALALALLLAACARSDDPTRPRPDKVYADGFVTPIESVTIEADGGSIVGSYDAWLRLRPVGGLEARLETEYQPADCAPAQAYFQRKLALVGLSIGTGRLSCREYTNARLPFDNGRWLLENETDGRVYYRIWKTR